MNLKYEIREIMYNGRKDDIVFDFEKKYEILSTFLSADAQTFNTYVFEAIDKVLSGESDYEELNGNVCGVEINKDKTQIYDNLAEEGMGNWCELKTTELTELVEIWCEKLKQFKEEN